MDTSEHINHSVRLPTTLFGTIKALAAVEHRSFNQQVIHLLRSALKDYTQPNEQAARVLHTYQGNSEIISKL
jgi:hypothetical protein